MVYVLRLAAGNSTSANKFFSAVWIFQKLEKTHYTFSSEFYFPCLSLLFPKQTGAFHLSYHTFHNHFGNYRLERFYFHFYILEQSKKIIARLLDIFLVTKFNSADSSFRFIF